MNLATTKSLTTREVALVLKIQAILMTAMSHFFLRNLRVKRKREKKKNKSKMT
jgi:Na+-transporting methylmalonyl-CoA/oxaloacetate decarboxylase gamma subunit